MQALSLKLSKRLQKIEQMVTSGYAHIWDCCCDHGFLGIQLLSRQITPNLHFVDIVPSLMTLIESKLQRFFSDSPCHWQTHCLDVAKLPLDQYSGKHLIIIAGVGGDLMIQFIKVIHRNYPDLELDFLLCPVHHQFALRQELIELQFSLKQEALVEDNRRFYEIIHVSSAKNTGKAISSVGEDIWQPTTPAQIEVTSQYLKKTLNHYQRIQQGNTVNVESIIDAYRALLSHKK